MLFPHYACAEVLLLVKSFCGNGENILRCLLLLDIMAHGHGTRIREVKAEGSEIQGHSWICGKFEVSLGHMRPCLRKTKKKSVVKQEPSLMHFRIMNLKCLGSTTSL